MTTLPHTVVRAGGRAFDQNAVLEQRRERPWRALLDVHTAALLRVIAHAMQNGDTLPDSVRDQAVRLAAAAAPQGVLSIDADGDQ